MRLDDQRRSSNIEDRRGQRGGGVGGGARLGFGGMIIVGLLMLFFPQARPLLSELLQGGAVPTEQAGKEGAPDDAKGQELAAQLGSIEDVWQKLYANGSMNGVSKEDLRLPKLVLFSDAVASGCGQASAAVGPFYCPADEQMYLDTAFFQEMATRFGAAGDFAQAYVIAHEFGHHIQKLTGRSDWLMRQRQGLSESEFNKASVRMELQADCYAGVWGHYADKWKGQLSPGDIDEALNAANAIGDDALQKQARGYAVPDSFTHGSSEQRTRWFKQGFQTGDPRQCDTFSARDL